MHEPASWPRGYRPMRPPIRPPRPPSRHRNWFIFLLAIVVILAFGTSTWLSYYVDALWFGSLGFGGVFWTNLRLEWLVFAIFTLATFAILYGSYLALKPRSVNDLLDGQTITVGGQPLKLPGASIVRRLALIASLILAVLTGSVMRAQWQTFALYWYAPQSGVADPIFHRPLSFYLFTLPAWNLLFGWLLFLAVISCLAAGFFLLVAGGARALEGPYGGDRRSSWSGISIAAAFLLFVIAVRVYLGRFDLLYTDHTVFGGVTYTDAHVLLPGLLVICATLVFAGVVALANALSARRGRWLALAVAPAVVCYLVLQGVSAYVSTFVVKPNELVRERPYIANNIAMTRQAYDLERVKREKFPADTSVEAADPQNNQATLKNIRLWDWRALQDTLRQIQEIRTYYDFPDIDIDRYELNGELREVMLATREMNINKLPQGSRNWINEKLIYTHGYGVTMNPVNGFTPEGMPQLLLSDMPVQSTVPNLKVTRPEIYFGELTNADVYVNTRQKEFNYPQGQENSFTSYEGRGGIVIGGFLRRLLIAAARDDLGKLPFSDDVNSGSRLLMRRNVVTRVETLAPFLTFDPDPYIVVGNDGHLYWMMDAFTTSDTFPYSTHYRLGDSAINYMRNSVKAVINAYDGATTFYVFDSTDPIIAAYRRLYPTLFKDASAMPPELRKHIRYPQLLLEMQAQAYGLYHMTDPEVFYNREDLWNVATEVSSTAGEQRTETMQPTFVLMKLPGETNIEFVEVLPFTPANRNNLIGWIAARSDGDHYGTAIVYDFPKTKLVDGPLQIEARIDQNAQLSGQLTLWNQQGSHVQRGNLLVIPVGKALLYAEPIFLQAERSPMPELRLVVLALQDKLSYGPTYEAALEGLFGGATSNNAEVETAMQNPSTPVAATPQIQNLQQRIAEAAKDLSDYQRLTSEGKLGEAGQKLQHLKQTLEELTKSQK